MRSRLAVAAAAPVRKARRCSTPWRARSAAPVPGTIPSPTPRRIWMRRRPPGWRAEIVAEGTRRQARESRLVQRGEKRGHHWGRKGVTTNITSIRREHGSFLYLFVLEAGYFFTVLIIRIRALPILGVFSR